MSMHSVTNNAHILVNAFTLKFSFLKQIQSISAYQNVTKTVKVETVELNTVDKT